MNINRRFTLSIILSFVIGILYSGGLNAQWKVLTDNPFYSTFDEIHYAVFTGPTEVNYFAVELINDKGRPLIKQKLRVEQNRFYGVISLNNRFTTGFYWLCIYPAAFYGFKDSAIYYPLVVINADNLDGDKWKKFLDTPYGKKTLHFLSNLETPASDNLNIRLAIIDEAGKVLHGEGYYTNVENYERKKIKCDENGMFPLCFNNPGEEYILRIGTAPGDTVNYRLSQGKVQNDIREIPTSSIKISGCRAKIGGIKKSYKRNQTVSVDLEKDMECNDDSLFIITAGKSILYNTAFNRNKTVLIPVSKVELSEEPANGGKHGNSFYLRGNYINPETGNPRVGYTLALIGIGEKPWMEFLQTDQRGNFRVDASGWPENTTLYASTLDSPPEGLTWHDDFFRDIPAVPAVYFGPENMAALDTFAREACIRRVLYYQYYEKEPARELHAEQVLYDTTRIYPKADLSYNLNDYVPFADIPDVILNILNNVHLVTSKKNGDRLFIFNNQNTSLNRNPLFLINGLPTFDLSLVLGLDVKDVQRIDLIFDPEALKPFGFAGLGGVMAIYTAQQIKIPNTIKIDFQGLHHPPQEYRPSRQDGIPAFSSVLYWNPEFSLRSNMRSFEFRLNNLLSDIDINVVGFDGQGGIIRTSKTIKIEK